MYKRAHEEINKGLSPVARYSLVLPILLMGCSDMLREFTDPAVRIANCIESNATSLFYNEKRNNLEIECDTRLNGEYVVFFAPPREYSNEELLGKGLSTETIRKFRLHTLNKSSNGMIYIIPRFTQDAGSHSTAYGHHVKIEHWQMANKSDRLVQIELTKEDAGIITISRVR